MGAEEENEGKSEGIRGRGEERRGEERGGIEARRGIREVRGEKPSPWVQE